MELHLLHGYVIVSISAELWVANAVLQLNDRKKDTAKIKWIREVANCSSDFLKVR